MDYGEFGFHLPGVDIIVYYPDSCRVLAVISTGASSKATLSERITQAGYWKLKLLGDETTRHVKFFLISSDEDGILKRDNNPPNKPKAMIETELDGGYILTEANLDESEKIKPFGRFSEDLKLMVDNIDRSEKSTR